MNLEQSTPALSGHKGLRGQILVELKRDQPLSVKQLAERHGVTTTAVRRHLKELEAEHLVSYEREQRGQGAPTFTYRLTAAGEGIFPNGYEEALTAVLQFVERSGGREAVRQFFAERFGEEANKLNARLRAASLSERLDAVRELLSRQGFMPELSTEGNAVRISEHNCAMHAVAARFPEVCHEELRFLEAVLGTRVERQSHIVSGCNSCDYTVNASGAPVQLTRQPHAGSPSREQA